MKKPFDPWASVYCLVLRHQKFERIKVGALGDIDCPQGWMYYAGRASRGWTSRFKRFVREDTTPFWHIDYLLTSSCTDRVGTFVFPIDANRECEISARLSRMKELSAVAEGLGSSDCENGCRAHAWMGSIGPERLRQMFFSRSPVASGWVRFEETKTSWVPRQSDR